MKYILTLIVLLFNLAAYAQDPNLQSANFDKGTINLGENAVLTVDGVNGDFAPLNGSQPLQGFVITVSLPATDSYILDPQGAGAVAFTNGTMPSDWAVTYTNDASTNFNDFLEIELIGDLGAFETFQFEITVVGNINNGGTSDITQLNIDLSNDPFTANTDEPTNNFVQSGTGVLPVEYTSFTGKSIDCQAELSWSTASETNNERFELQHSENAKDFKEIAKLKGAGTTLTPQQYSFTHETAAIGTNYYRIKQVDTDGASDYSAVIAVENDCKPAEDIFTVYPNPVGDGDLTITYEVHREHEAVIEVLNLAGEQVLRTPIVAEQGKNRFSLNTRPLAAGTYYVSLYKNGVKVKTERIMKMTE
ncbi:MAG: T9SS type A sorting domain-containing protein [Bacteroidota bacterium]